MREQAIRGRLCHRRYDLAVGRPRVAALVPDPIQQIKDGGATYEMNELVFSPRYFNVVVTLPH